MQSALVWAPCIFLVILSPLDIYYAITSKYSNIPWGYLNVFRLILYIGIIALSIIDIVWVATWPTDELFDLHIVTPVIKIVTFVCYSSIFCIKMDYNNNFFFLDIRPGTISNSS